MTRGMNKTGSSVPTKMHFAKKTTETKGKSPKMIKTKKNKRPKRDKATKRKKKKNKGGEASATADLKTSDDYSSKDIPRSLSVRT